jgi:hypothetical protein
LSNSSTKQEAIYVNSTKWYSLTALICVKIAGSFCHPFWKADLCTVSSFEGSYAS